MPEPRPPSDPEPTSAWILEQVRDPRHLPSFPKAALEVVRLCEREDATIEEVTQAVSRNPGTATRLLRVANSPILGTARRVATLPHAISVLGLLSVSNLTFASVAIDALKKQQIPDFDFAWFWRVALATAVASRSLMALSQPIQAEEAFIGGLLQDIGVTQLAAVLGPPYLAILADARGDPLRLADLERERFGLDHATATAGIFAFWEFPTRLVESARRHLEIPAKKPFPGTVEQLAFTQNVGERIGWALASGRRAPEPDFPARLDTLLGLDATQLEQVLGSVKANVAETSEILRVGGTTPADIRALEVRAAEWIEELSKPRP